MPTAAHFGRQRLGIRIRFIVDAGGIQNRLPQRDTPPGGTQVNVMPLPHDHVTAHDNLRHVGDHFFGAAHDILIVGVGFVKLQLRKFRIVLEADAFIAEVAPDLVHAVKAATISRLR